jgi:hypothetical protein
MKNSKDIFNLESKKDQLNVTFSPTNESIKNNYNKNSNRNMKLNDSFRNQSNFSKSNSCLLILIAYAIIGYLLYEILK